MSITIEPIGILKCERKYRYEQPRQATLAGDGEGVIQLNPGHNFEQALEDLDGFDRVWLIYQFHLNEDWKPKVRPPRGDGKKGVFATRSPHRPNPLGMSCVELVKIKGRAIHIRNFDLLDGTPIFDIKPYIPYCDSFPDSATGWLPKTDQAVYSFEFTEVADLQMGMIYDGCGLDLKEFAVLQLSHDPFSSERKRLTKVDDSNYILACRTWRIHFSVDPDIEQIAEDEDSGGLAKKGKILVKNITSSYAPEELLEGAPDKYNDKDLHRRFTAKFC